MSFFGNIIQGQGQKLSADYNAQIGLQNATIAEQQSTSASEAQQRDASRKIGAATAAYGASGVQTDSGSPLDVLAESARNATLDNLTLKYNYALKAQGLRNQAALSETEGEYASTASILNAASGGMKDYQTAQALALI
jgi:hypothetical protein